MAARQGSGMVIELRRLPDPPLPGADLWTSFRDWSHAFFENSQIVIDIGTRNRVSRGDLFVVLDAPSVVHGPNGQPLGELDPVGSMIEVIDAYPKFSVCKLMSYLFGPHLKRVTPTIDRLAASHDPSELVELLPSLAPVTVGQQLVRVSEDERARHDRLEDASVRAARETDPELRLVRYQDVIREADHVLLADPDGYFSSDALFGKGFAFMQLGRFQDAIDTFETFLDRYPFSPGVLGAKTWIATARASLQGEFALLDGGSPIGFAYLDDETLDSVREAALALGFASPENLASVTIAINPGFVAISTLGTNPLQRLVSLLHRMNVTQELVTGEVPLRQFLNTAIDLAGGVEQELVFRRALELVDATS